MKLFNLSLFIISLGIGTSTPLWAAEASQEPNTYQSSLDDYKSLSDDNLSDWKSINVPSNGGGHAGHSMAPKAEMDRSEMAGMNQDNMKSMSDSKSAMQPMKKEDMPEMSHDEMAGHDHGGSDMKAMDHSKMSDSKPNDTQPSQGGCRAGCISTTRAHIYTRV